MLKNSVQFFGLPGSGKTTMLKGLLDKFPDFYEAPPKFKRLKRFVLALLFVFRFPWISLNFIFLIFKNPIKLWGYLFHLLSVSFATHFYVLIRKNNKIFLIDEGVAQRLLSVASEKFSAKQVEKYIIFLKSIPSPIVVTLGGNFSRFVLEPDRMTSKRNILGESYYKKWSENLSFNFDLFLRQLKNSKDFCYGDEIEILHKNIQSLI